MLSFVGLGLSRNDISIKAIEEIKKADEVYAEFYTGRICDGIEKIEEITGRKIKVIGREEMEDGRDILNEAMTKKVCIISAGDAMAATTHVELRLRAMEMGIETRIIHGVSITTAAASALGLQIYKFGRIISLPRPYGDYFPLSPYDGIKENVEAGLHTLILLDTENEPMTANEAMEILMKMEERKKEGIFHDKALIAVLARVSCDDEIIKAGYLKEMVKMDFGKPLHSIVLPGKMHVMEAKALVEIAGAPEEIMNGL
ncbi:MAG: diphthine synthase [Thermoplasmata archaeon]|nr:diphthine synthase [Thermoplasmata archaeon]